MTCNRGKAWNLIFPVLCFGAKSGNTSSHFEAFLRWEILRVFPENMNEWQMKDVFFIFKFNYFKEETPSLVCRACQTDRHLFAWSDTCPKLAYAGDKYFSLKFTLNIKSLQICTLQINMNWPLVPLTADKCIFANLNLLPLLIILGQKNLIMMYLYIYPNICTKRFIFSILIFCVDYLSFLIK